MSRLVGSLPRMFQGHRASLGTDPGNSRSFPDWRHLPTIGSKRRRSNFPESDFWPVMANGRAEDRHGRHRRPEVTGLFRIARVPLAIGGKPSPPIIEHVRIRAESQSGTASAPTLVSQSMKECMAGDLSASNGVNTK